MHAERLDPAQSLPRLPSPQKLLAESVRLISSRDPDLRLIARTLGSDPVLSMLLLKAVNSGYFSLRSPVQNVGRAVALLGANTLRSLLICVLLREVVAGCELGRYPIEHFWESSARRAVLARHLAIASGTAAPEDCFTVGLCQDLGVLLSITETPRESCLHAAAMLLPCSERLRREQQRGPGHDQVAARWMEDWQCPAGITVPVRFHHAPELAPAAHVDVATIAHAADAMADLWFVKDRNTAVSHAEQAIGMVGLSSWHLDQLVDAIEGEMQRTSTLLGITRAHSFSRKPRLTGSRNRQSGTRMRVSSVG